MENPGLDELERFRPQWVLYWGDRFARSQFAIWEPYLRRSRYRFLVLVDGPGAVPQAVLDATGDMGNLVFAHSGWPIARLEQVDSVQGVLYVGNRARNFHGVTALPGVAHVFLGHGHSGKAGSARRVVTLYDAVFVASYSDVARWARPDRQRLRSLACAIGAPIVGGLQARSAAPAALEGRAPRVLYLPTWEGHTPETRNYCSLDVVLEALRAAPPTAELAIRPHPATGHIEKGLLGVLEQYEQFRSPSAPATKGRNKADAMNHADVAVSDNSGATSEFLFTRKPVVMPWGPHLRRAGISMAELRRIYPYAYVWDVRSQPLDQAVRAALADRRLARERERYAQEVFRGHRSLDEAAQTLDIALSVLPLRGWPVPLRLLFEAKLLLHRTRGRLAARRARRSVEAPDPAPGRVGRHLTSSSPGAPAGPGGR